MSLTATELAQIRTRANGTSSSMDDDYLNTIFDEVSADYSDYSQSVKVQAVIVQVWEDLLTRAVTQIDYTEGEASEKRSRIFDNIERMLKKAEAKLNELTSTEDGANFAQWGGLRRHDVKRDSPLS